MEKAPRRLSRSEVIACWILGLLAYVILSVLMIQYGGDEVPSISYPSQP